MEWYHNGGTSSLPVSANLPSPMMCGPRPSSSSSSASPRHSPLEPPSRLSPLETHKRLSHHDTSPRLSPNDPPRRLSPIDTCSSRYSPVSGPPRRLSSGESSSRLSVSESHSRLSPSNSYTRHSPHEVSPHRFSPSEPPSRLSPLDTPPSRRSSHAASPRLSPHDSYSRESRVSPYDFLPRLSPCDSPTRFSSHESTPRHGYYDPPPRLSPCDSPTRFSPQDPPSRNSPHGSSHRLSTHESLPKHSPCDSSASHSPQDPPSHHSSHEAHPFLSPQEMPTRLSPLESRAPHPFPVPSGSRHKLPEIAANHDTDPPSPKLHRKETDLSFNNVRLQETYINVETLEERETEKQLSEAWKRKRRRSIEPSIPEYLKSAPIKRIKHPLEENVLVTFFSTFASIVLTCAISIPLSLAFLLVFPVAFLMKVVTAACHKPRFHSCISCHNDYLAPHDAQFLLQDVDNHAVIHSVLIIDASMNLKRIKQLLATRVVEAKNGAGGLMYPRLTQMVSQLPAGPAWVLDQNFNLHNHVFSGPAITTEEELQKYVSSLLSQPLPPTRPLWEIIVLHDYGRSRDTVLVCRLHQCLSDGMSLIRVLCQSLSDNQIMHIPQKPHFGGTTYGMNLIKALLIGPMTALTWLWWWRPDLNPLTVRRNSCSYRTRKARSKKSYGCKRDISDGDSEESGAYTVWNEDATDGQVVFWSAAVSVNRVVRIKQVTRTCLNDVLLAALSGALRLTLQRQGVMHPPDLKVSLAVDLRSNSLPFTIPRLGTKAALVPLSLPLSWEASIPRLWEVRSRVDDMKASADPVVSYGLVWLAYRILPMSWARRLLERLHRRMSLQYSSLPGPTSSLLLGGYTVKHIYNVSPVRDPTPVSVTVLTYADQVHVSVAARRSLPSAVVITKNILAEFENQCLQMSELLAHRRIPGEQRRGLVFSLSELNNPQPISDLQKKLSRVQAELQKVTQQYEAEVRDMLSQSQENDTEIPEGEEVASGVSSDAALIGGASYGRAHSAKRQELATKVQSLKDEFTDLLTEIRRRKSITEGGGTVGVGIQTEFEEDDGEIRRPRKRALSTTSTWSSTSGREVSSCMARPLTTSPQIVGPPIMSPPSPSHEHSFPATQPRTYLVTDIT
ncbi:uncharacterized protein [Macrobrachium rosenbergii]|uniref:uncharacterized protein n=1 Tax=Macrobrachium rosenbergii TaxID=79674 RepID=UPI0034D6E7E8